MKWLPPSMAIDLASAQCIAFYQALKRLNLPLHTHVGKELSVEGAQREDLGHLPALRRPPDQGLRVIAAYCASLDKSPDRDAAGDCAKVPLVDNYALFTRLISKPRCEKLLFGDISAMTQFNRAGAISKIISNRT